MSVIAEGVQTVVVYKFNTSGVISPNTLADTAAVPGASGGRIAQRISSTLDLVASNYAATEIRRDRQEVDFRLGTMHVQGDISGELSVGRPWMDFIEAVHRDTKITALSFSQADFTSVAMDPAGTIIFGAGDPVALGLFVGDGIRVAGMSPGTNDNVFFTILSFGGTSNRTLTVYPLPAAVSSATTFTVSRAGDASLIPRTGHINRLVTIEHHGKDIDYSELFTECRVIKYTINFPAGADATFAASFIGRWAYGLSGASAPYFTAPTAEFADPYTIATDGVLLLNGVSVGTITGLTVTNEMAADVARVSGQNFVAGIGLGHNIVSGQLTAYVDGATLPALFKAETECSIIMGVDPAAPTTQLRLQLYMPRVKLTSQQSPIQGEGLQQITASFHALEYNGSTAGVPKTAIRIVTPPIASVVIPPIGGANSMDFTNVLNSGYLACIAGF